MISNIFRGDSVPHDAIENLPQPPPWRTFDNRDQRRGATFQSTSEEIELVNAALYLRRPLLITGKPGSGKSSLAYAVAHELKLGSVLRWSITSRSTLTEGLYQYDAIGRLQEANLMRLRQASDTAPDIGRYIRLGPLGTALLPSETPRVLLIDEIDKSDIDLPNDLLHIFEEGEYEIPELVRLPEEQQRIEVMSWGADSPVTITHGRVRCRAFPFVVFTSNGERDFPPAFLRRCLRLSVIDPDRDKLEDIVRAHLGDDVLQAVQPLIDQFISRGEQGSLLATDQLLNAIYLVTHGIDPLSRDRAALLNAVLQSLSS
jgi:MoxR-like ATPase